MARLSSSISQATGALQRLPRWLRWPVRFVMGFAVLALLGGGVIWLVYASLARGYDLKKLGEMPERSIAYDMRGVEIGKLHGENRVSVPLAQVSTHFIEALLAREDDRFYSHGGVDFRALVRALVRDLKDREFTQGASTLTMQLARNSFSMRGKSLHRKLLEMAVARRIESNYSKDEILELYVNRIFFGTGLYGVERASQSYFGKSASGLTLDEAAMLAAIIRGPNKFSPFRAYEVALSGKAMVLDRMVLKGRADSAAAGAAKLVKTKVLPEPQVTSQETYALDAVRRKLNDVLDAEDEEDGGLRIFSTLDLELQAAAEKALEDRLSAVEKTKGYPHITRGQWRERVAQGTASGPPDYVEGAVVAIDNSNGATLVVVGGRDLQESAFNRALLANRQVGSTFKPFVYTVAVQDGLLPTTLVDDGPIDIDGWQPKNSDGKFGGLLPAELGLAKSRNTMAVRVGERARLDRLVELIKRADLGEHPKLTPQLFIGNHDTTLLKLTSAFTCFPNAGQRLRPFLIERIENKEGDVIFRNGPQSIPVMAPGAAWCVTKMMEKVLSPAGTAASARALGYKSPAAGKTGTTDDFKDAWFVGFNRSLTCGVWVGLDQPERITGQGYGSRMSLPVWVDVMKMAEKLGYPAESPLPEVETTKVIVCALSGQLATRACDASGTAVQTELPLDLVQRFVVEPCPVHGRDSILTTRPGPPPRRRPAAPSLLDRLRSIFR